MEKQKEITLEKITQAYDKNIKPYINYTQTILAEKISQITDNNVYLKLENLQKTGSFKIRGALNKIANLTEEEKKNDLVAASAGNHAQGVALAAKLLGLNATIIIPKTAPIAKIQATKNYGAKVILYGEFFDECLEYAKELSKEKNLTLIEAYDDSDIIIGQGSIALEILEEIDVKNIDYCLVPVGGGGIMSGIATVLKTLNPNIKMIGIEAENVNSLQQALANGKILKIQGKPSIADGIAVKQIGKLNFEILKKYVDQVITVSESEIAAAVLFLLEKCKIVAEGSGAVGVAALLNNKLNIKNKNVVSIISGGNIDVTSLSNIINKGLFSQNRRFHFSVISNLRDNTLNEITDLIKKHNAIIYKIDTTNNRPNINLQQMKIDFVIDVSGEEQVQEIITALKDSNYNPHIS